MIRRAVLVALASLLAIASHAQACCFYNGDSQRILVVDIVRTAVNNNIYPPPPFAPNVHHLDLQQRRRRGGLQQGRS
ncbi:hypothetical protein DFJ74DRAFT_693742 [Hyaloraphidium curvatum]|nr:hypothetical protein DFJ74DRAFT_693742 [Hyaloraphidium curvatum]